MKTAEELFEKHSSELEAYRLSDSFMTRQQFIKALAEHERELAEKIMDLMKVDMMNEGEPHIWNQALTEVLSLIERTEINETIHGSETSH